MPLTEKLVSAMPNDLISFSLQEAIGTMIATLQTLLDRTADQMKTMLNAWVG